MSTQVVNQIKGFFKTKVGQKYIDQITSGKLYVLINLDEIHQWNSNISDYIINSAIHDGLKSLVRAFRETLKAKIPSTTPNDIEVGVYGECIPLVKIRDISSEHIGKLIRVRGIVNRTSAIRPFYTEVRFRCRECSEITSYPVLQENPLSLTFPAQKCANCGSRQFDPVFEYSKFVDSQEFSMQELHEDISSQALPMKIPMLSFKKYLMNTVNCGDVLEVVGVVNLVSAYRRRVRSRFNDPFIEVCYIKKESRDPEDIEITPEEERQIKEIAELDNAFEFLIDNLAPSLYGLRIPKEACLYALFGGVEKKKTDITTRGNINVLFVGDPSCIAGDSRVVLADGRMPQIANLGDYHLQPINIPLYSAKGKGKCGIAKEFHKYSKILVYELITESGRRLVGSCNQPLLRKEGWNNIWRRMDELKVGDEIRVVPKIPCRKRKSPISKELAGLIGYMLADGWKKNEYEIGFIVNDEETDLISKLQMLCLKEFNKKMSVRKRNPEDFSGKWIHKKPVYYLSLCGKNLVKKFTNELDNLFSSSNDVVSAALSWFFDGDGHVLCGGRGKNGIFAKQTKTKEKIELLRAIQLLLLRFGIYSIVDDYSDEGTVWIKIRQSKSIRRFAKFVGFNSKKKQSRLRELLEILPKGRAKDRRWEKIRSIKPFGYIDVYDVVEPTYHQFVANGIVVHNTGKSQLLITVADLAARGIYATGKGTSAAGLTAALNRDEKTGEWGIDAGVLVLADKGVACIDEIDKMDKRDRVNIHEAMEQQTVTISKAGIHAKLMARAAVVAAANPSNGVYDHSKSIQENIGGNFPPTLLNRFDLIFVLTDEPDKEHDKKVLEQIADLRDEQKLMDRELFKKYIIYAKRIKPIIPKEMKKRLINYFLKVREGIRIQGKKEKIPIAYRQAEALFRIAEAHARALLKTEVDDEDVNATIRIFNIFLKQIEFDVQGLATDKPRPFREHRDTVMRLIREMQTVMGVERDKLIAAAVREGVPEDVVKRIIVRMLSENVIYRVSEEPDFYRSIN